MAKYTIELKRIIENGINIFPFNYDFYDEKRRPEFEKNFIRHFYFNEIGQETVDRFILHLEDKMKTVFPYYNELFKTAQIEYSILDNYKLNEKTTIKRENKEKTQGTATSTGAETSTGTATDNEEVESNDKQTDKATVTGTKTTNTTAAKESEATKTDKVVEKFLDTPDGKNSLDTTDYLTNIKQTERAFDTSNVNENGTTSDETSTKDDTDRTINTEKTATTTAEHNTTAERNTTANNSTEGTVEGSQTETLETLRVGNIGVDTDADMLQKHIKLQKILREIEKMFFNECEDLFMLVY